MYKFIHNSVVDIEIVAEYIHGVEMSGSGECVIYRIVPARLSLPLYPDV